MKISAIKREKSKNPAKKVDSQAEQRALRFYLRNRYSGKELRRIKHTQEAKFTNKVKCYYLIKESQIKKMKSVLGHRAKIQNRRRNKNLQSEIKVEGDEQQPEQQIEGIQNQPQKVKRIKKMKSKSIGRKKKQMHYKTKQKLERQKLLETTLNKEDMPMDVTDIQNAIKNEDLSQNHVINSSNDFFEINNNDIDPDTITLLMKPTSMNMIDLENLDGTYTSQLNRVQMTPQKFQDIKTQNKQQTNQAKSNTTIRIYLNPQHSIKSNSHLQNSQNLNVNNPLINIQEQIDTTTQVQRGSDHMIIHESMLTERKKSNIKQPIFIDRQNYMGFQQQSGISLDNFKVNQEIDAKSVSSQSDNNDQDDMEEQKMYQDLSDDCVDDEYTEREMIVTRNQHIQATPYLRDYGTQTRQIVQPTEKPILNKTHIAQTQTRKQLLYANSSFQDERYQTHQKRNVALQKLSVEQTQLLQVNKTCEEIAQISNQQQQSLQPLMPLQTANVGQNSNLFLNTQNDQMKIIEQSQIRIEYKEIKNVKQLEIRNQQNDYFDLNEQEWHLFFNGIDQVKQLIDQCQTIQDKFGMTHKITNPIQPYLSADQQLIDLTSQESEQKQILVFKENHQIFLDLQVLNQKRALRQGIMLSLFEWKHFMHQLPQLQLYFSGRYEDEVINEFQDYQEIVEEEEVFTQQQIQTQFKKEQENQQATICDSVMEEKQQPQIYQIYNVTNYHLPEHHSYFNQPIVGSQNIQNQSYNRIIPSSSQVNKIVNNYGNTFYEQSRQNIIPVYAKPLPNINQTQIQPTHNTLIQQFPQTTIIPNQIDSKSIVISNPTIIPAIAPVFKITREDHVQKVPQVQELQTKNIKQAVPYESEQLNTFDNLMPININPSHSIIPQNTSHAIRPQQMCLTEDIQKFRENSCLQTEIKVKMQESSLLLQNQSINFQQPLQQIPALKSTNEIQTALPKPIRMAQVAVQQANSNISLRSYQNELPFFPTIVDVKIEKKQT
eukprot:403367739